MTDQTERLISELMELNLRLRNLERKDSMTIEIQDILNGIRYWKQSLEKVT